MKRILRKTTILLLVAAIFMSQSVFATTPKALSDIKGNWAEAEIQKLFAKGIITGNEFDKYEPAKSITRAEFTALLTRAMGLKGKEGSSFYDPGYNGYWARPYIETAVAEGIIVPSEAGENFFGNVPLKRSDMAVMMARALKLTPSEAQVNPYVDITEPNGYITKLYEEYLMRGYTENGKQLFKTNNQTIKAEAATVVSRILEYKANPVAFVAKSKAAEEAKQKAADAAAELQRKADAAGVSVELFKNPANLNGKTFEELHDEAIRQLGMLPTNWETKGTPEKDIDYIVQLAKDFVYYDWNIDYRTVKDTYIENVKNLVPYDWIDDGYINRVVESYYKNNVISKGEFFTSTELLRYDFGFTVRGTLKFVVYEPTSPTVMKDNGITLKYAQWYKKDVEVQVAGSYDKETKIYKYRVYRVEDISGSRIIQK